MISALASKMGQVKKNKGTMYIKGYYWVYQMPIISTTMCIFDYLAIFRG